MCKLASLSGASATGISLRPRGWAPVLFYDAPADRLFWIHSEIAKKYSQAGLRRGRPRSEEVHRRHTRGEAVAQAL